jgi:hypothetical protein
MTSRALSVKSLFILMFIFVVTELWAAAPLHAQENLGVLKVDRFFLEPSFSTDQRTYDRGFSIGRSFLGASWSLDNMVSAHILFGPKFMLLKPARYGEPVSRDLSTVEAYGQLDTGLGVLRAGLVPIAYGLDGLKDESRQSFPDNLFYQKAFLQKRDYGASYFLSHNNFTTVFAVHNGESAMDTDNRYWMTGRWSYEGPAASQVGVSASTGRWVDQVTLKEQRIRMGNVFAGFEIYGLGLAAEGNMLSSFSGDSLDHQSYEWHVDLEHPLWSGFGLQMRYDFLEPAHDVLNDQVREFTYGFNWHYHYWNSILYALGATRWEEGDSMPHASAMVVWKLTPLTQQ